MHAAEHPRDLDAQEPAPGAAVSARGLSKVFGTFRAVDNVTFDVRAGEVFGLLGSNGAGKSTVIRVLCGLMSPSEGVAEVLGIDVGADPEAVKRHIGYMTQRFSLYPDLSVRDNLTFYGGVYGLFGRALADRIGWATEIAGLSGLEHRLTGDLPGGWKQRLALASALLHEPRVVFLDEPTGGVDPLSRRRFWTLIDELAAGGITVIVTTHYLDEAEHCGRVALMHAGRLVALGGVSELKTVFAGRAILEITHPRPLEILGAVEREPWVLEASVFGSTLHVVVADAAEGRERARVFLGGDAAGSVSVEPILPSLEDVFIHYIQEEEARLAARRGDASA